MNLLVQALVLCLLMLTGCGQLEQVGPADPCAGEDGPANLSSCGRGASEVLSLDESAIDRSQGGELEGEHRSTSGRPLTHVFALDFSGSMRGDYPNPGEQPSTSKPAACSDYYWTSAGYRQLVDATLLSELSEQDPAYVLLFNKYLHTFQGTDQVQRFDAERGRFSSDPAATSGRARVLSLLTSGGGGQLPAEPRGFGPSDMHQATDLPGVLDASAALFEATEDRDGILWVLTDNIISLPGTSEDGANADFYRRIRDDPRWQIAHAYPLHHGEWLCDRALVAYGLYYSSRELIDDRAYRELAGERGELSRLDSEDIRKGFAVLAAQGSPAPGRPFKLKPQHIDVIRLAFEGGVQCGRAPAGVARTCAASLKIENLLNHRKVDKAVFRLSSRTLTGVGRASPGSAAEEVPSAVPMCAAAVNAVVPLDEPIGPGESRVVQLTFEVPPVEVQPQTLRDHWDNAWFDQFDMVGAMDARIEDLQTSMVIDEGRLEQIYGVEHLPDIFRNPWTANMATSICLVLPVDNPEWLISMVVLSGLVLLLLAFLLLAWLIKGSWWTVYADDRELHKVRLSRVGSATIQLSGRPVAKARLGLSGAVKLRAMGKGRIVRKGGVWELRGGDEDSANVRIKLVAGRARKRSGSGGRRDDF